MEVYDCKTIEDPEIRKWVGNKSNTKLNYNLWYQLSTNSYFGIDFLRRHVGDLNSIFKETIGELRQKYQNSGIQMSKEWVYEYNDLIRSFKNSRVLILGAGGSTNKIDWEAKDYDHIISCNNFYLNEKIFNTKLTAIYLNIDHKYPELEQLNHYLDQYQPLIIYGGQINNSNIFFNKYSDKIFTRFRCNTKIGILPRLILCMIAWEAKEISILGMDGHNRSSRNTDSVFYRNPIQHQSTGTIESKFHNDLDKLVCAYEKQYILFFDYIFNYLKTNIIFKNPGETIKFNMLTDISKVMF